MHAAHGCLNEQQEEAGSGARIAFGRALYVLKSTVEVHRLYFQATINSVKPMRPKVLVKGDWED